MGRGTETRYRDGSYLARNPDWHAEDSPWKARWIRELMQHHRLRPATVAEIGCGAGRVLLELAASSPESVRFVGYEISSSAHELCPRDADPRVTFRLGDLLADEDALFDLVLAIDVFEHVEDYLGFLRRLASRGRQFIFHVPLDLSVQSVLRRGRLMTERTRVGHLHYFTKETALATLQDAGYRVTGWRYTPGALQLPDRGALANLARLPRRFLYGMNRDLAARLLGGFSLLVLAEPEGG